MTPLSVLANQKGSKECRFSEFILVLENWDLFLKCPWKVLEFCFSEVVLTMCSIIVLGVVRSLLNLWPTDDLRGNEVYVCYSDLVELFHNIGISGTVLTLCLFVDLG